MLKCNVWVKQFKSVPGKQIMPMSSRQQMFLKCDPCVCGDWGESGIWACGEDGFSIFELWSLDSVPSVVEEVSLWLDWESEQTHTHTQKICLLDKCNNNKHIYSIFKSHSGKVSLNSQPLNKEISLWRHHVERNPTSVRFFGSRLEQDRPKTRLKCVYWWECSHQTE